VSVNFLKNNNQLREKIHERAKYIKNQLKLYNIPVIPNQSHIIPIFIGDANKAKQASDKLMNEY